MTRPHPLGPETAPTPGAPSALTTREEWERRIQAILPEIVGAEPFGPVLQRHLPVDTTWSAIEIGAIPGRFLRFFHRAFGYRITALDFARDWTSFDRVMAQAGITQVEKLEADFLDFAPSRTYEVVASFGFIEHFRDVAGVIRRHADLVGPGGYLVLGVPNFTRLQYAFHWLVDRANLRLHNTQAMDRGRIERWVGREGFRVCYSGHLGAVEFWHEAPVLAGWQRVVAGIARGLARTIGPYLPPSPWYSPYYLLIARRDPEP
jgi:SAM-dependent methyltransferase